MNVGLGQTDNSKKCVCSLECFDSLQTLTYEAEIYIKTSKTDVILEKGC